MHWQRRLLGAVGLFLLAACTATPVQELPTAAARRTIDLSHVIRQDAPNLPAEPLTRLERDPDGRMRSLTIGARTGTLLEVVAPPEAPLTVDLLSPRELVLDAVVIDVRDAAQDTPGYRLDVAAILAWEERHGPIPADALVLVLTGWDVRWGDAPAYLALDGAQASQAPSLTTAALDLLLRERAVTGIGIDTPTLPTLAAVDPWLAVLNLTNLEQLPSRGTTVVIGALKVQSGDRSPARVVGLIVAHDR